MARSRNIKPGFFKNDKLAECGPVCMIVFAGLWCIADYRGNLEYRPKRIKIDTIPYFDCIEYGIEGGIEECIEILARYGFVKLYTVNDTQYLHINGFKEHQNPHKNERDAGTSIPGIEKDGIDTDEERCADASDRADSLVLIPDSLNPGKRVSIPFEDFWELYPRRTNKAKAQAAWKKLKPSDETFEAIRRNIETRLRVGDWTLERKNFIPHASTYLNNARWEDEIIGESGGSPDGSFDLEALAR
jgi:hypothetical protein